MAKAILGIEIGSRSLKAAEVKNGELLNFVSVDMPDGIVNGEELVSFDAMADLLKTTLKENGFTAKEAALVVPDANTHIRRLRMPVMTDKQLLINLPYEFHDVIGDDKDQYVFDYAVIEQIKDDEGNVKELDVLGATMRKDLVNKYAAMFKRAGRKLVKAMPYELAIENFIRNYAGEEGSGDFAVLDLGWSSSRVDIFRNTAYETTRVVDTGMQDVINSVADILQCDPHTARAYGYSNPDNVMEDEQVASHYSDVAVEVMRAINYYTYENPDNQLETLYYCGGGSNIPRYVEELEETVPLTLKPLSSFGGYEG